MIYQSIWVSGNPKPKGYILFCLVCEKPLQKNQQYYCSLSCSNSGTKRWLVKEEKKLCQFYEKGLSALEISSKLKRSVGAIRNKAYELKITKNTKWSKTEEEHIKNSYAANIPVDIIASQLNRSFAAIACKANELDITKNPGEHIITDKIRKTSSARMRKWWQTIDEETKLRIVSHSCSEETRKKIGASLRNSKKHKKAMRSQKRKQILSDSMIESHRSGKLKGGYSLGKRGIRKDIGIYVRSSWEANIARYLNLLIENKKVASWEYEPYRFEFEEIKRGTRSYLPDFCVVFKSGRTEWWEVKGWMTAKAKTAIKRFHKYYPWEKLIIIDKEKYRKIEREFSYQLPEWEESK